MNIYGDRGNIVCLQRRCRLRGIELEVAALEVGDALRPDAFDMLFMGGAQDREQTLVAGPAATKGALREAVEDGVVFLGVCGGYQLSGRFYRGADGDEMPGAGVFDLYTLHPGPKAKRLIGNVSARVGRRQRWSASRTTAAAPTSAPARSRSRRWFAASATTAPAASRARATRTPSAATSTARCCRRTPPSPTS